MARVQAYLYAVNAEQAARAGLPRLAASMRRLAKGASAAIPPRAQQEPPR